jgi:peptidoglycan/xylan/chitin deacetylase (PgdA/CDA1 family)
MASYIPVLMYHNIVEHEISNASDWITIDLFEQQLLYLQKKGYTFITPKQLLNPKYLPKKPILITFDDGYENVYLLAFPILKKLNIPFTLFLITNFISNKSVRKTNSWDNGNRPKAFHLSKEMIKDMLQTNLLTIGSHSISHIPFNMLSENEINNELGLSKQVLEHEFNQTITLFSYPGGYIGNKEITYRLLKKNQYKLAFGAQKNKLVNVTSLDCFNINRINIENKINFTNPITKHRFEVVIHPFLNKLSSINKLNFIAKLLLPYI